MMLQLPGFQLESMECKYSTEGLHKT